MSPESAGSGAVWLDSLVFPNRDIEHFEKGIPSGWKTGGSSNWISVENHAEGNHAMVGWGGQGSKALRAGPVGLNTIQSLEFTRTVSEGRFVFWYWPALEPGEEFRFILQGDKIETYTEVFTATAKVNQDDLPVVAYPALHPDTIAVGASTSFDYRADYSQYGFGLDFVAPSGGGYVPLITTDRTDTNDQIKGFEGNYTTFTGTSASSPLAAGVGALLLSANPDLTAVQVRDIMQDTCEQIGNMPYRQPYDNDPNTNLYYGHGRINAGRAVNLANSLGL